MRAFVAVAGLMLSATQAPAQEVLLRLDPPAGQVSHYRTDVDMQVQLEGMGEFAMRLGIELTQTVTGIEDAVRLVEVGFDSVTVGSEGFPDGMMGAMSGAMQDLQMTMRMDTRGRVLGMDVVNGPPGLPVPGMDAFGRGVAQVFLPEGPVAPGATWTDTTTVDMSAAGVGGNMSKNLTYRLDGTDTAGGERVAMLSMSGTFLQAVEGGGGVTMDMTGSMQGTITLSLDAGRITAYAMEMNGSMESPMSPTPATLTVRVHLTLVE